MTYFYFYIYKSFWGNIELQTQFNVNFHKFLIFEFGIQEYQMNKLNQTKIFSISKEKLMIINKKSISLLFLRKILNCRFIYIKYKQFIQKKKIFFN